MLFCYSKVSLNYVCIIQYMYVHSVKDVGEGRLLPGSNSFDVGQIF